MKKTTVGVAKHAKEAFKMSRKLEFCENNYAFKLSSEFAQ